MKTVYRLDLTTEDGIRQFEDLLNDRTKTSHFNYDMFMSKVVVIQEPLSVALWWRTVLERLSHLVRERPNVYPDAEGFDNDIKAFMAVWDKLEEMHGGEHGRPTDTC